MNTLAALNTANRKINMEKSKITSAALIAIGIAIGGWFIKTGIDNYSSKDRFVTVKGLAECEVKADRVVWYLPYKCVGNDLAQL